MTKHRVLASSGLGARYGVMGTPTGHMDNDYTPIKVGDIITYKLDRNDIVSAVVIKTNGIFCPMGLCGTSLDSHRLTQMKIIIPAEYVTGEIVKYMHSMRIEEVTPVRMTQEQIERKLGYAIEIIK